MAGAVAAPTPTAQPVLEKITAMGSVLRSPESLEAAMAAVKAVRDQVDVILGGKKPHETLRSVRTHLGVVLQGVSFPRGYGRVATQVEELEETLGQVEPKAAEIEALQNEFPKYKILSNALMAITGNATALAKLIQWYPGLTQEQVQDALVKVLKTSKDQLPKKPTYIALHDVGLRADQLQTLQEALEVEFRTTSRVELSKSQAPIKAELRAQAEGAGQEQLKRDIRLLDGLIPLLPIRNQHKTLRETLEAKGWKNPDEAKRQGILKRINKALDKVDELAKKLDQTDTPEALRTMTAQVEKALEDNKVDQILRAHCRAVHGETIDRAAPVEPAPKRKNFPEVQAEITANRVLVQVLQLDRRNLQKEGKPVPKAELKLVQATILEKLGLSGNVSPSKVARAIIDKKDVAVTDLIKIVTDAGITFVEAAVVAPSPAGDQTLDRIPDSLEGLKTELAERISHIFVEPPLIAYIRRHRKIQLQVLVPDPLPTAIDDQYLWQALSKDEPDGLNEKQLTAKMRRWTGTLTAILEHYADRPQDFIPSLEVIPDSLAPLKSELGAKAVDIRNEREYPGALEEARGRAKKDRFYRGMFVDKISMVKSLNAGARDNGRGPLDTEEKMREEMKLRIKELEDILARHKRPGGPPPGAPPGASAGAVSVATPGAPAATVTAPPAGGPGTPPPGGGGASAAATVSPGAGEGSKRRKRERGSGPGGSGGAPGGPSDTGPQSPASGGVNAGRSAPASALTPISREAIPQAALRGVVERVITDPADRERFVKAWELYHRESEGVPTLRRLQQKIQALAAECEELGAKTDAATQAILEGTVQELNDLLKTEATDAVLQRIEQELTEKELINTLISLCYGISNFTKRLTEVAAVLTLDPAQLANPQDRAYLTQLQNTTLRNFFGKTLTAIIDPALQNKSPTESLPILREVDPAGMEAKIGDIETALETAEKAVKRSPAIVDALALSMIGSAPIIVPAPAVPVAPPVAPAAAAPAPTAAPPVATPAAAASAAAPAVASTATPTTTPAAAAAPTASATARRPAAAPAARPAVRKRPSGYPPEGSPIRKEHADRLMDNVLSAAGKKKYKPDDPVSKALFNLLRDYETEINMEQLERFLVKPEGAALPGLADLIDLPPAQLRDDLKALETDLRTANNEIRVLEKIQKPNDKQQQRLKDLYNLKDDQEDEQKRINKALEFQGGKVRYETPRQAMAMIELYLRSDRRGDTVTVPVDLEPEVVMDAIEDYINRAKGRPKQENMFLRILGRIKPSLEATLIHITKKDPHLKSIKEDRIAELIEAVPQYANVVAWLEQCGDEKNTYKHIAPRLITYLEIAVRDPAAVHLSAGDREKTEELIENLKTARREYIANHENVTKERDNLSKMIAAFDLMQRSTVEQADVAAEIITDLKDRTIRRRGAKGSAVVAGTSLALYGLSLLGPVLPFVLAAGGAGAGMGLLRKVYGAVFERDKQKPFQPLKTGGRVVLGVGGLLGVKAAAVSLPYIAPVVTTVAGWLGVLVTAGVTLIPAVVGGSLGLMAPILREEYKNTKGGPAWRATKALFNTVLSPIGFSAAGRRFYGRLFGSGESDEPKRLNP